MRVEELHARYAHALDSDELERWPDFFTANGRYRVTTAENEARGLPLPVLYAEGEAMLRDRIASLRHANIYEPQSYRQMVSPVLLERDWPPARDGGGAPCARAWRARNLLADNDGRALFRSRGL